MTGKDFKRMRILGGILQKDMAAAFGFTPEHLSKIESGRSPVLPVHVLAAQRVLDMAASENVSTALNTEA